MAEVRFKVYWNAKVEGSCEIALEREPGQPISELKSEAEDKAQDLVQEALNNVHEVDVDTVDATATDAELCKCRECKGRKYKIDVLEGGAGLIKVGPCPSCQRIPNTVEVCKHVMEVLAKAEPDEEEE